MTDPVSVTQEDREAAAVVFYRRARVAGHPATVLMERHHAKVILAGEGDGYDAVQAAAESRRRLTRPTPDTRPAAAGSVRQSQIDASRYVLARCAATHQRNITVSKAVLEIALGAAAPTPDAAASETNRARIDHGASEALGEMVWTTDAAASEAGEVERLREALAGMVQRHSNAVQNWTQAAVDAQRSGNRDLFVSIQNTVLTALDGFPIKQARAALTTQGGAEG